MLDPKRLTSLLRSKNPSSDQNTVLNRADEEQLCRLGSVGYMELAEDAGAFSCGACKFVAPGQLPDGTSTPDGGPHCVHPSVRSPVSPAKGCCNLFFPADGWPVFQPDDVSPPTVGVLATGY